MDAYFQRKLCGDSQTGLGRPGRLGPLPLAISSSRKVVTADEISCNDGGAKSQVWSPLPREMDANDALREMLNLSPRVHCHRARPLLPPWPARDSHARDSPTHFSAGGGATSRPSGETPRSHGNSSSRRTKDGRDARDVYREYLDEHHPSPARRQPTTKRALPPPQPIFVPDSELDNGNNPPSPTAGGPVSPGLTPRRNKSIMQRIRKMRDSPNVPVGQYDEDDSRRREASPGGRYGRSNGQSSPSDEAFVYVDHIPMRKEKSLPTPPPKDGYTPAENQNGYFDSEMGAGSGAGLGRKTSLMKKVRGVVKGGGPSK
ncbi:uncharacterized protein TRAVEDRAFT_41983 [Trametes versicolor FP-101664 SS1]|uniref:uncharacterized protein n=1 Tax=Trametes versicolor (strain FP-101664) TaxID=717944 RepID=UPI0004622FD1|nr:uncharacterized protein TRAVEDRAFT_41983 [Trametes versicolor FP-101664 SS1]EIW64573.1 hypothetical protein TRAVEDRAFT_41983 [Trametes versicolor FP-101664 SS1]